MSKRDYKQFSSGSIFHVYNRGNNKEVIFKDEEDYRSFLFRLGLSLGFKAEELNEYPLNSVPYSRIRITNSDRNDFKLHAFCLMNNHFHFLVEQCYETPISKLLAKTCTSYAKYFNLKYKRVGHVFQDKFKAVFIEDDPQLMWASAYIHTNPVKDGLVNHPSQYKWSSFNDYFLNRNFPFLYLDSLKEVVNDDFEKETLDLSKTVFDRFTNK